ncbi:hypothetical protein Tco_0230519, partial [Tanacetum coccineum]
DNHPIMEQWQSDLEGLTDGVAQEMPKDTTPLDKPTKKGKVVAENLDGFPKQKHATNAAFYNEPFTFKEMDWSVRNLVASPFTTRIRDYDMPDGLKVPKKLKNIHLDDHLTIFIGTMDVQKLPEPAWCHFFHITLSGKARFWYNNLTPG